MRTLEEIKQDLSQQVAEKEEVIQKCETEIEKWTKAIEEAENKVIEGQEAIDIDAHDKAKKALWTAKNNKELFEKRLDKLTTTPMVDRETYDNLIKEIEDAQKSEQEKLIETASKHIKKIKELSDKSLATMKQRNDVLDILEHKIGNDYEEYKKNKHGGFMGERYIGLSYRQPSETTVYDFYDYIKGHSLISEIK